MKAAIIIGIMLAHLSSHVVAESDSEQSALVEEKKGGGISKEDLAKLLTSNISQRLKPPVAFSYSPGDVAFWAEKAKHAHKTAPVSVGDPSKKYDVIIQIGHYPRTTGKTGGQGKHVNEQQIASLVAVSLVQKLKTMKVGNRPITTLLIGADSYKKGLKSTIFLSFHTDASDTPCSVGPSVGYQQVSDAKGMHVIALALAVTLGIDAEKFMNDNYTSNLAKYYAYSSFSTDYFKGVLEMSELTCSAQEDELLTRAASLASNLATAIQFALR